MTIITCHLCNSEVNIYSVGEWHFCFCQATWVIYENDVISHYEILLVKSNHFIRGNMKANITSLVSFMEAHHLITIPYIPITSQSDVLHITNKLLSLLAFQ